MEFNDTNKIDDIMIAPAQMKFFPLHPGTDVCLLFSSPETGRWTVLLRSKKGTVGPQHKHFGAGEYYVVSGLMEYRAGVAAVGSFGYEPLGVIHKETRFLEDTTLLFTGFGPVLYFDDEGNTLGVLDNASLEELCQAKR
jgi:acetylacetone-cleaving enzyme